MKSEWILKAGGCCLLIFTCLASRGAGPVAPAGEQDRPPVVHLNFDEGSGLVVKDRTGNGHNGAIMAQGKHTAWVESTRGRALEFNADRNKYGETGRVVIQKMDALDFTKGFTVELWLKFKTVNTTRTRFHLIGNEKSLTGPGFHLVFDWSALHFRAGSTSGKLSDLSTKITQFFFVPGIWYHVVVTFDGTVARLYVDGKETTTSASGFVIEKGIDNPCIGAATGGYYGLEGAISSVKIYDYARSPVQVMRAARF